MSGKPKVPPPLKLEVSDEYRKAVDAFVKLDDQLLTARDQVHAIKEQHRVVENILYRHIRKGNHPRTLVDSGRSSVAAQDIRSRQAIHPAMIKQAAMEALGLSETDAGKIAAAVQAKRKVKVSQRIARTIYEAT